MEITFYRYKCVFLIYKSQENSQTICITCNRLHLRFKWSKNQRTYLKRSIEACNDLANVWYVGDRIKTSIIQWSTCFCVFAKLSWQIYEFFLATNETTSVQDSASKANKDGHSIESDCIVLFCFWLVQQFLASSHPVCLFA